MIICINNAGILIVQSIDGDSPEFSVGMSIPISEGNRHYSAVMEMVAAGTAKISDPVASVDDSISAKSAALQSEKCRVRDAGFDVDGLHFDSDQAARTAYLEFAVAVSADSSYSKNWKASGNNWVTMNATLFAKVKAVGEAYITAVFDWQAAQDAQLASIKAAFAAGTMSDADARAAIAAVSTSYTAA